MSTLDPNDKNQGQPVVPVTVLPEGKSFPVPPDKNPGGTIPDHHLPQTGQDRPELKYGLASR